MSGDDKTRWDRQHGLSSGADQPSGFLRQVLESDAWHIPHGLALDVATGKGRNAIFLAEMGFRVVGLDISTIALEEARRRAAEKSLEINKETNNKFRASENTQNMANAYMEIGQYDKAIY